MRGKCPRCANLFEGQLLCPNCGIQLTEEGAAVAVALPQIRLVEGPSFPQRAVVAAVCTLGLYHGLKHLMVAGSILITGSSSLSDDVTVGLLAIATIVSAAATGMANRRAEVTGAFFALIAMIGLWGPELFRGHQLPREWLIGLPILYLLAGALGGAIGRMVVAPAPRLPEFSLSSNKFDVVAEPRLPTEWVRLIPGAILAIVATIWAE